MTDMTPHFCIKPACSETCSDCDHAISDMEMRRYAVNYAHLRRKPLSAIDDGGVFAGKTPDNLVLNGDDLDKAIRAEMKSEWPVTAQSPDTAPPPEPQASGPAP